MVEEWRNNLLSCYRSFVRSFLQDGKIDLTEFQTYFALYGPMTKDEEKIEKEVGERLSAVTKKVQAFKSSLPPPFRGQARLIVKAGRRLMSEFSHFSVGRTQVSQALLAHSPQWMQTVARIMGEAGLDTAKGLSKSRLSFSREHKPERTTGLEWPRG